MPIKLVPPRPGKTPNWSGRGTYLGRYINRSTKTRRRSLALKALARWQGEIERGEFTEPGDPTFASAALAYMKAGGERTYLTPILNHFRGTPLTKIGQAEIDAAAQEIYPRRSPATVNRQLYTPISAVLRHAGVALVLRRPKGASGVKTSGWLWPDEAKRLFAKGRALDAEFGVLLTVLCYTGLRLSEALGLTTDQLKLDDAFAFVPTTKNGDPRPVFLPPVVVDALCDHPRGLDRPNERVFKFHKGGHIYSLLRAAAAQAEVTLPERQAFHLFRHTYGTWMRRYGNLDTRGLVGTGAWKDRKSAERYEHVVITEEAQRAALLPGASSDRKSEENAAKLKIAK
jgi:integrase